MFLVSSSSRAVDPYLQTLLLRLGGKHRQLARQVGDSASSPTNSTAGSSNANSVPEGTTFVFGSWAYTADRMGGFSSHLVTPNSPKPKTRSQLADIRESADLDEKRVPPELDSVNPGNVTTQNQTLGLVEFDTNSYSEKPHFSKTLGKYQAHLKTIKRPKIKNSELLAGVDQVSRSIEGCIKLAETALGSSASQQIPEALNPPQKRSGDMLSGIDWMNSKLADCIKCDTLAVCTVEMYLFYASCA